MKPDYKNWVPRGMVIGFALGFFGATLVLAILCSLLSTVAIKIILCSVFALVSGILLVATLWLKFMYNAFSYNGKRKLSKKIIEGIAAHINLPSGKIGLDVGCGSGALTIACSKRNPDATMIGIDRWGAEYASYNKLLCEHNAKAEGIENIKFQKGNALKLDFSDETFDAVTSNYVYHNIVGANKQECLRETLRVLKKGGIFAIHDVMSKMRYGDMEAFAEELKNSGYEKVELIDTTNGLFMSRKEANLLGLSGSTLLLGKK